MFTLWLYHQTTQRGFCAYTNSFGTTGAVLTCFTVCELKKNQLSCGASKFGEACHFLPTLYFISSLGFYFLGWPLPGKSGKIRNYARISLTGKKLEIMQEFYV